MIGRSLAREGRIRIDTRLVRGLPPSVVSTDELKQVVINLLTNSVQAIEGPGRVLVCTRMSAGNVSLVVSDTGQGIPKEIIPRIFDPFFTTKGNGEGTGLGLSVVYGIVTKYNGGIDVKSRLERGTRISLSLPCLAGGSAA
jgi:two-component system NtrC family sensor kinase